MASIEFSGDTRGFKTDVSPRDITVAKPRSDKIFHAAARAGAIITLSILGLIGLFLLIKSWPALKQAGAAFFTRFEWNFDSAKPSFGIAAELFGTAVMAAIALAIAVPVAVGSALFVNEYAPRAFARPLTAMIDLLAAIPSLVYGMWGLYWLQPRMNGLSRWLAQHVGWIPIFATKRLVFGSSMFVCGIVLSLMILPIIGSVSREVFAQVPRDLVEGALALGGSRWGAIRRVILPFGRGGVIGASMLGLGRALGETIAIALILSFNYQISPHILNPGGGSVAGLIALKFPEAGESERSALVAAGLALFILTLVVNMGARVVVNRTRSKTVEAL